MKCSRILILNTVVLLGLILLVGVGSEIALRVGIRCVKSCQLAKLRSGDQLKVNNSSYRVMLLGDSFTAPISGYGEHLCKRLETNHDRLDCLNIGKGGTGPLGYLHRFRERLNSYQPNLVLLNYYVGNDLTDTLYETDLGIQKLDIPWYEHSHLYQYVEDKIIAHRYRKDVKKAKQAAAKLQKRPLNPHLARIGQTHPSYLENNLLMPSEPTRKAWITNKRVFHTIRSEAQKLGAELAMVVLPRSVQINRDLFPFFEKLGVRTNPRFLNSQIPQEKFLEHCRQTATRCFDVLPHLRKHSEQSFYLENDDHLNDAGKQKVAELVVKYLEPFISMQLPQDKPNRQISSK